jgi:hypothetical protein
MWVIGFVGSVAHLRAAIDVPDLTRHPFAIG